MLSRFLSWGAAYEGSTRSAALLRIALALIVWVRFADEVAFFQASDPANLLFGSTLLLVAGTALVGFHSRLSLALLATLLALGYVVFGGALNVPGWLHHHVYLLVAAAALLSLTPCDRSYSVDRYRALRRAEALDETAPAEHGNLWGLRLIGLQLSAIYFWAAWDKTDWAFLSGQRLEQTLVWVHSGRPLEEWLLWPPFLVAASVLVVAVEYFLAVAIHIRRWQWLTLPVGVALHVGFYLFLPVQTYSITMVALYLALIDANTVHRFIDRMEGHAPAAHRL
jgi:hypothetical protein